MSLDSAMVIKSGLGSRVFDMSGNEYIDYLLGSGPMLLGHAHPSVVATVREHVEKGSSYLLSSEPSILLAEELVAAVPCAEQVAFSNTGSESVFHALRLARAYRNRTMILKFEGGYHGQADHVSMSNQWTHTPAPYPEPVPNSKGIPDSVVGEVLVAPFNDIEKTTAIIERFEDQLAAVIVEPMQRTIPPAPGFLQGLSETTVEHGIPLIFDEVVTGFRLGYGGAQGYYGVVPDLCALGKSLSGGHPIGVVCGSKEIMSHAEGVRRITGGYVALTGTYSGNPISCAVALAVLEELRVEGVYDELFERGRRLMSGLQAACDDAGVDVRVTGEPPAFEPWFTDVDVTDFRSSQTADSMMGHRFAKLLLDHGVLKGHEKFFVSMAHSDTDIDVTVDAIEQVVAELKR